MVPGKQDIMAQAYFLAQLQAAKNGCKCNVCQILRKASDQMTAQFLAPTPGGTSAADQPAAEMVDLVERE